MKAANPGFALSVCLILVAVGGNLFAQSPSCDSVNGTVFNLEPRLNAQPQLSPSIGFLLNRVTSGVDLVVGAANESAYDSRFVSGPNNGDVFDAFYAHRSGANCTPDFEGTTSASTDYPKVVADAPRDAFFLATDAITGAAIELLNRTTAARLLSSTVCPNGTELQSSSANATCWPVQGMAVFNPSSSGGVLLQSTLAVDPRTSGTGAGDVYVAAELENTSNDPATRNVELIACANATLSCGSPVVVSGADTFASYPWVQVREDGVITISYWTYTKPFTGQPNPVDIKFVTCTPQGAPKAPVCSKPNLVLNSAMLVIFNPGDNDFFDYLFPKHANRLESNGSFTTFLVYDQCVSIYPPNRAGTGCTKVNVALTQSTNDGATWSIPAPVESASGHQFFGTIAVDASTGITNIAYYSSQNDLFLQRVQVYLSQIAAGSTTVEPAVALTSASTDPNAGIQNFGLPNLGDRIGLAVSGTGTKGESRAYVHYIWDAASGISNGTQQPDPDNTIVTFSY